MYAPSFDASDLFKGFGPIVWALGVDNAFGGLVVALVIKYVHKYFINRPFDRHRFP